MPLENRIEDFACDRNDPQRVFKAAMLRARVYVIGKTNLANCPQALKKRRVDYRQFPPRKTICSPEAAMYDLIGLDAKKRMSWLIAKELREATLQMVVEACDDPR